LRSRIDRLKKKHGDQMEQLAIRQKQEMFIAQAQYKSSAHERHGIDNGRRARPALGDTAR
jgi:hypothetical protein